MSKFLDLTGMVFGKWTVIARTNTVPGVTTWECHCSCGAVKTAVSASSLRSGSSTGCGCDRKRKVRAALTKHGKYGTKTYWAWKAMLSRCRSVTDRSYPNYGGRGITVDASWREFSNFYADMGEAPDGLSLGRIDVNKGYCKQNCRWATMLEQANSRRKARAADRVTPVI